MVKRKIFITVIIAMVLLQAGVLVGMTEINSKIIEDLEWRMLLYKANDATYKPADKLESSYRYMALVANNLDLLDEAKQYLDEGVKGNLTRQQLEPKLHTLKNKASQEVTAVIMVGGVLQENNNYDACKEIQEDKVHISVAIDQLMYYIIHTTIITPLEKDEYVNEQYRDIKKLVDQTNKKIARVLKHYDSKSK